MSARKANSLGKSRWRVALLGGAAILASCGGNVTISGDGGTSGSTTSTAQGGGGASSGGAGATGTGASGGSVITTSNAFCFGADECSGGQYCDDANHLCLASGEVGYCQDASFCSGNGPVCGCDGAFYESDCAAFAAGTDLALTGCEVPPGLFQCGVFFCEIGAQACFHYVGFAMYDACEPYPMGCDTPSCACFPQECECAQDGQGNFVVKCNTGD